MLDDRIVRVCDVHALLAETRWGKDDVLAIVGAHWHSEESPNDEQEMPIGLEEHKCMEKTPRQTRGINIQRKHIKEFGFT